MIQSTSGSPWDLVMGWVCLVWLVLALWGRFRAARKRGTVVLAGGWYVALNTDRAPTTLDTRPGDSTRV